MNTRAAGAEQVERRLGYVFTDRALFERALTHASANPPAASAAGAAGAGKVRDNEVLEFIGDRVIGLLAAERLAELNPASPEGDLAPRLNALVSRKACADVARGMGLGPALRLSGSETKTGGRDKDSILAGACEAVMAAIYRDGGLAAARAVFLDLWADAFSALGSPRPRDAKTALQEWAQGMGRPLPVYAVTGRSGPDHQPTFTVEVSVIGLEPAKAQGGSRQEAEMAAAKTLLQREGQT